MSEYVTLLGAEQVLNAARRINEAADKMQQAASSLDDSLRRHREYMENWLVCFQQAMEKRP